MVRFNRAELIMCLDSNHVSSNLCHLSTRCLFMIQEQTPLRNRNLDKIKWKFENIQEEKIELLPKSWIL